MVKNIYKIKNIYSFNHMLNLPVFEGDNGVNDLKNFMAHLFTIFNILTKNGTINEVFLRKNGISFEYYSRNRQSLSILYSI